MADHLVETVMSAIPGGTTTAIASDLPKEGKVNGTFSSVGTFKAMAVGKIFTAGIFDENGIGLVGFIVFQIDNSCTVNISPPCGGYRHPTFRADRNDELDAISWRCGLLFDGLLAKAMKGRGQG